MAQNKNTLKTKSNGFKPKAIIYKNFIMVINISPCQKFKLSVKDDEMWNPLRQQMIIFTGFL